MIKFSLLAAIICVHVFMLGSIGVHMSVVQRFLYLHCPPPPPFPAFVLEQDRDRGDESHLWKDILYLKVSVQSCSVCPLIHWVCGGGKKSLAFWKWFRCSPITQTSFSKSKCKINYIITWLSGVLAPDWSRYVIPGKQPLNNAGLSGNFKLPWPSVNMFIYIPTFIGYISAWVSRNGFWLFWTVWQPLVNE